MTLSETGVRNANSNTQSVRKALPVLALYGIALMMLLFVGWMVREPLMAGVSGANVADMDAGVLRVARSRSTPLTDAIFVAISLTGSPVAIALWVFAGCGWLVKRSRLATAMLWLATVAGSGALSVSLKHIFQRARPPGAAEFLHAISFGFPSTHTVASLVTYGTLCYLLGRFALHSSRQRMLGIVVTVVYVGTIAASRVVLGVHYFSDVCAGLVVGLVWLSVCLGGLQYVLANRDSLE